MTEQQRIMKDMEQDNRLNNIDLEISSIKGVTHGNDLHNWDGIIKEHNKMMNKIQGSFIAIVTTLLTVAGGIAIALLK